MANTKCNGPIKVVLVSSRNYNGIANWFTIP